MAHKPLTVARRDYVEDIVNITNKTDLPMFVKVEVLERVLDEMRPLADNELKRDEVTEPPCRKRKRNQPNRQRRRKRRKNTDGYQEIHQE